MRNPKLDTEENIAEALQNQERERARHSGWMLSEEAKVRVPGHSPLPRQKRPQGGCRLRLCCMAKAT